MKHRRRVVLLGIILTACIIVLITVSYHQTLKMSSDFNSESEIPPNSIEDTEYTTPTSNKFSEVTPPPPDAQVPDGTLEPPILATDTIAESEVQTNIPPSVDQDNTSTPMNASKYPIHTDITATVFWVGEPEGNGSSEDNALSAWDDRWQEHYGGYDDPFNRNGYYPKSFIPLENPFYFDLPYNDFTNEGERKAEAYSVVYWADEREWNSQESMLKNRWAKIWIGDRICFAQWEDSGPYEYDDHAYVFGNSRPNNRRANNAGMDVSPAVRDCLGFEGLNNDVNRVSWQFIDSDAVPEGPWSEIVTTSGTTWE